MNDNHPLRRIGRDPTAFEAFYRDNVEAVQRFIARRVDDPHLAADLTADVFLAVIEASDTYRCLLYTSPSPRDRTRSRMPSSA